MTSVPVSFSFVDTNWNMEKFCFTVLAIDSDYFETTVCVSKRNYQVSWLKPVIPATPEDKARELQVQDLPRL